MTLPGSAGSSTHHADEEEVAHNSPLLRRVSDPFSNRPVVGNFQELRADLKRSEASFNPQILRKRHYLEGADPAVSKAVRVAPMKNDTGEVKSLRHHS